MSETLAAEKTESDGFKFPCGNCGASMVWDPLEDALACSYCQHVVSVPRGEGTIVERPFTRSGKEPSTLEHGFGVEARFAVCNSCGAKVTYQDAATSETCVYCGESTVLAQEANRNAIRPESLIPIDVDRASVDRSFKKWVRGLWFRPSALKKVSRIDAVGVYVPFWTFDCQVHSEWSADAGYYYYVTQSYTAMVNGKPTMRTRQVRKTRWRPAWGERHDHYDDMLILASSGFPTELVAELGEFDTTALVPYKPHYLAGWRAEEYRIDLEQGWEVGKERVTALQQSRCFGDVPGDTQRNLRVKDTITKVHWKHVLLPIWSLQYRFNQKIYTVLVHGQTGRVVGDAPLSWIKIVVAVLSAIAAVVVAGAAFDAWS